MANYLKVDVQEQVLILHRQGLSNRGIARELGIYRGTVNSYVNAWDEALAGSKPAKVPPGSEGAEEGDSPGSVGPPGLSKPAKVPPGSGRRSRSLCEGYREQIEEGLELGLSAKRIHQDLVREHEFAGGYDAVKRFVRRLRLTTPLPFRRLECLPGEEAQVDFGRGAPVLDKDGKRRLPHLFRITLSHSRKSYSEAVWHQRTETFIRVLENAFRYFGGVPRRLVVDNLKAAVKKADWFDPELNPKVRDFCRHYGVAMLPTKPRRPRHKGKIEASVKYAQNNGLKGRTFPSLQAENAFLLDWEEKVADTRIHGTTREQVRQAFERDRLALQPLPPELFPCFQEGRRKVHADGHVEVDKAYYSVPPEYLRREVWVRYDLRLVRVFNERFEQIAVHPRSEPGRWNTDSGHIPREKINSVEHGPRWLLGRAELIGEQAYAWARTMLNNRGPQGLRTLQGLLSLTRKHPAHAVDEACRQARALEAYYLRQVRQLLRQPAEQPSIPFLEDHELIRALGDYARLTPEVFIGEDGNADSRLGPRLEPHPATINP